MAMIDDTEVNVENPQRWGKTTAAHRLQNTLRKDVYNSDETQRQRPLVPFFGTRGGYKMEATTPLSLSVHTLYNYLYKCNNN